MRIQEVHKWAELGTAIAIHVPNGTHIQLKALPVAPAKIQNGDQ
jgi:hypothetical protein